MVKKPFAILLQGAEYSTRHMPSCWRQSLP